MEYNQQLTAFTTKEIRYANISNAVPNIILVI